MKLSRQSFGRKTDPISPDFTWGNRLGGNLRVAFSFADEES